MAEELKLCPCCDKPPGQPKKEGGSDERSGYNFTMKISCCTCGLSISRQSSADKNGWCNDKGEALASVVAAWNTRAQLHSQPVVAEAEPVHWRAVMCPEDMAHEPDHHRHVTGFTTEAAGIAWVAEQLTFRGWRYTLEPLYLAAPPASGAVPVHLRPLLERVLNSGLDGVHAGGRPSPRDELRQLLAKGVV